MKCKFCGSQNTKEISVIYLGGKQELKRHGASVCQDCGKTFSYISITEIPKIVSTQYSQEAPIDKEKIILKVLANKEVCNAGL